MRARDQSSIFSIGGKFRPDYGLLLELTHSYSIRPFLYVLAPAPMHEQSLNYISHLHASFVPPLWIYVDMNPRPPLS